VAPCGDAAVLARGTSNNGIPSITSFESEHEETIKVLTQGEILIASLTIWNNKVLLNLIYSNNKFKSRCIGLCVGTKAADILQKVSP